MNRPHKLRKRIRWLTWFFIVGLFLSGATAIPLVTELNLLVQWTGANNLVSAPGTTSAPIWAVWLVNVRQALEETQATHPLLFYGTDWLAFGHFVIAIAFVGGLKNPVRNRWLFDFGLIACGLVVPYALSFGAVRGIPIWWRLIDASFGVIGLVPLWICRHAALELERNYEPKNAG